jgi:hypothetical protein
VSRQRPGPSRADWADPTRLAALANELHARGRPRPQAGPARARDHTGRVLSAIKVTIRLSGTGTVRYFDSWKQLAGYLTGDDFAGIAGNVRSILINHRPIPGAPEQ